MLCSNPLRYLVFSHLVGVFALVKKINKITTLQLMTVAQKNI